MNIYTDSRERRKTLGTKHLCEHCDERFYDLNRRSVNCPYCDKPVDIGTKPPLSVSDSASVKEEEGDGIEEGTLPTLEGDSLSDKEVLIDATDDDSDEDVSGLIENTISHKSDSSSSSDGDKD